MVGVRDTCYLCGESAPKEEASGDHVPPKQFFPSSMRENQNLLKVLAHIACNKSFQNDEDYFKQSLGAAITDSPVGWELWKDIAKNIRRPEATKLSMKILDEFQDKTSKGIYFPKGTVGKKFDSKRVHRIVWKIIRGLYFHHNDVVLPEATSKFISLYDSKQAGYPVTDELIDYLVHLKNIVVVPKVFEYRKVTNKVLDTPVHLWGLMFWDRVLFVIMFHDPFCECKSCVK